MFIQWNESFHDKLLSKEDSMQAINQWTNILSQVWTLAVLNLHLAGK